MIASTPKRVIAVDWSGREKVGAQRKHIWAASVADNWVTLGKDRTREEVIDWLIDEVQRGSRELVVGLDFAFSFPISYFKKHAIQSAPELWRRVEKHGEQWLRECDSPFWGRPGKRCPDTHGAEGFRETDQIRVNGISPKSVFQIGGAGAVGTGSIRGMQHLLRLQEAGFAIWPFDPPAYPLVVEIYPRLLTGRVLKSKREERWKYLQCGVYENYEPKLREQASASEDAFDAFVSAVQMWNRRGEITSLQPAVSEGQLLEGMIWPAP